MGLITQKRKYEHINTNLVLLVDASFDTFTQKTLN